MRLAETPTDLDGSDVLISFQAEMKTLYPSIKPHKQFHLAVDTLHSIYVEECGRPDGLPVLFLHGGPGAGCEEWHRRFFNPAVYRIVLFDQRGAGRSTPHAELAENTTGHLIEDIEKIRQHCGIERWVIFGGSWGSTLALAYAETHPERCLALVLRGVFLCRTRDIHWFYQHGANILFPDFWSAFERVIPPAERGDMVAAYYRRLTSDDAETRLEAAREWSVWEGRLLTLLPDEETAARFGDAKMALGLARIESHYFINRIFQRDNQLLDEAHKLHDIPGFIVHGRYDVVCPVEQAFALHQRWPQAKLHVVADAGHAATEPGITHHLIDATDEIAHRLE